MNGEHFYNFEYGTIITKGHNFMLLVIPDVRMDIFRKKPYYYMSKTLIIVSFFVEVAIFLGLALLFPIVADHFYGWFSGLFHGAFLIPNWIISWFADGHLLRAPLCSGAYNIWWLTGAVLGIISSIFYAVYLALIIVSKK